MITQAVISAGGFGTRLRPFTDTHPKPMLPVLGRPLLEWHVAQFKRYGVTDFIFTLHHLPEVVTYHFKDGSKWGVHIEYAIEESPLGSAGGLKIIQERLQDRFFYIYGDTFSLMDYSAMQRTYASKSEPIGMQRVKLTDEYSDADVAEMDEFSRFTAIHGKPHDRKYEKAYRMRGSFILENRICDLVPPHTATDLAKDILPAVLKRGENFYGYECDEYSKGIDTKEKLDEVEAYLRSKEITPWW